MKLLDLLPTERSNKTVTKGNFFDQCVVCRPTCRWWVSRCIGSVSNNTSVFCWWCVAQRVGRRVGRRIGGIGFFTFTQFSWLLSQLRKLGISHRQFHAGGRPRRQLWKNTKSYREQISPTGLYFQLNSLNNFSMNWSVVDWNHCTSGSKIALSWAPMRLKIFHWRPDFYTWSPAGD